MCDFVSVCCISAFNFRLPKREADRFSALSLRVCDVSLGGDLAGVARACGSFLGGLGVFEEELLR